MLIKLICVLISVKLLFVCESESGRINISIETPHDYNGLGYSSHNCSYDNDNDYVMLNNKEVRKLDSFVSRLRQSY